MVNSVGANQKLHSVASDLGLHRLLKLLGKYGYPLNINNFASLFNCIMVGQSIEMMMAQS